MDQFADRYRTLQDEDEAREECEDTFDKFQRETDQKKKKKAQEKVQEKT